MGEGLGRVAPGGGRREDYGVSLEMESEDVEESDILTEA
jgi:hypothetical protein